MMFKSARRDSVITEDPTEFVEPVRRERASKIKRPFTLAELRSILELASDEWCSMILFGLYSGQRLGDVATLRWSNIDLLRNELRPFNPKDREDDNSSAGGTSPEEHCILACRRRSIRAYPPESF
jgi:integrase